MPPSRSTPRSPLELTIESLAARFARDVVAALRTVPLAELAHLSGAPIAAKATSTRKVANYPKCAWAGCGKNRSPRTLPYCGEHHRAVKDGQQPPPGSLGTGLPRPGR